MPNMTAEDCWKKYRSLTNGITGDRDDLKKKLDTLYAAYEQYDAIMAKMAKAQGLTDDEIMALSTEAAKLKEQLAKAVVTVNEQASVRNKGHKLAWLPVWLKENIAEMAEKLSAIMRDVEKLSPAERAEFDRKARGEGYPLGAIARDASLAKADLRDIWKQYRAETEALLKDWTDQANIYVKLEKRPETSFAGKVVKIDKAIATLTAILVAREKSRQKKAPPAPRMLRLPRPFIMSHH